MSKPLMTQLCVVAALLAVTFSFSLSTSSTSANATQTRSASIPSADGDLDPTFGNGGNVSTHFPVPTYSRAFASAIQSDDKLLVGGAAGGPEDANENDFAITRYNTDGTLDTTFGGNGRVETDFAGNEDQINGIAVQTDGKIVAAGFARMDCCTGYEDFALARYNTNGTLDATFGTGGLVHTDIAGAGDKAYDVKIQPDGKIVVAGTANNAFALARYNTNGSLDTSFGNGGIVGTGFYGSDLAHALAIQSDGKIVAVGSTLDTQTFVLNIALARYNTNGTLDGTFGNGGEVITNINSAEDAYAVAIQPADSKIVIAGDTYYPNNGPGDAVVARYNTNGSLDTTFNSTGIVVTDLGASDDGFNSVVIQADNKIVAAGKSGGFDSDSFSLARYTSSGSLDTSFGNGGIVSTSFATGSSQASRLLVQTDGKLVASGTSIDNNLYPSLAQVLARYNPDGTLDSGFGTGGKITTYHVRSDAAVSKLAMQGDGKILAVGTTSFEVALARYNSDGTLDPTFGTGGTGTVTTTANLEANGFTLQGDGKIVTIGRTAYNQVGLARFNTNGTLDGSFGTGGIVATDLQRGSINAYDVKERPDGKLVALAYDGFSSAVLIRYNPNGTLDATFGTGGIVFDGFTPDVSVSTLLLQGDGKIVIAGSTNGYLMVARYNADGTPDASFGTNGRVLVLFGAVGGEALTAAIQGDGKIVAGGDSYQDTEGYVWAMVRCNPNGTLDNTFGTGGKVLTDFPTDYDEMLDLKVLPNGQIVGGGGSDGRVARYNSDGSLDTTFGNGGSITNPNMVIASGLAIQADSKIVAGGYGNAVSDRYFTLARYMNGPSTGTPTPSPTHSQATATSATSATSTPTSATSTPTSTATAAATNSPPGSSTPLNTTTTTTTATATATAMATMTSSSTSIPASTATPASTTTPTACSLQFTDVPSGSTFYPYVRCLACRGIINGYPDGTFKPNANVTRGQLSKIVSNAAGFSDAEPNQMFQDVPLGSTFQVFIGRLASRGYINGYACGGIGEPCQPGNLPYFRPNNNATRGQISKIDANAAGFSDPPSGQQFEDLAVGSAFYTYTYRLVSRGVMAGYPCGGVGEPCIPPANLPYFRPNNNATRGQTSKIVGNTYFPDCQTP